MRPSSISLLLPAVFAFGCASAPAAERHVAASDPCTQFSESLTSAPTLTAPFTVARVEPIHRQIGRVRTGQVIGANVTLLADPALSSQGGMTLLECRRDRAAESDPLHASGRSVAIEETRTGYQVRIVADLPSDGQQILDQAIAAAR